MNNHVRILGWFYLVICALTLAVGLILCAGLSHSHSPAAFYYIAPPVTFASCFVMLPGIIGGGGLLRLRRWGRGIVLLLSMFLIPLLPIGTVLGIYGLWILLNPETDTLFSGTQTQSSVKPFAFKSNPTLNLLGTMACVGAAFFLVIKVGFLIHHEPLPEPFDSTFLTITAGLIL